MLNCCIQHKRKHDHSTSSDTSGAQIKSSPKTTDTRTHTTGQQSTGQQSTGPQSTGLPSTGPPHNTGPQPNASQGHASSPKSEGSDTDEDEFFEALESQERNSPGSDEAKKMDEYKVEEGGASVSDPGDSNEKMSGNMESESGRCGVLRQCGDLVLVATGEPLYIPITQVRIILNNANFLVLTANIMLLKLNPMFRLLAESSSGVN